MLVNYAAKSRYRWGGGVPIVVRGPCGGGVHGGPFHSQNPEAYFMNVPGPQDRGPRHRRRRQGPDDRRHPRPRSRASSSSTSSCTAASRRTCPTASIVVPDRQGAPRPARARTSRSSPTRPCSTSRWRRRRRRPKDGIERRGPGPAHAPAPRRGGDPGHGGQDRARSSCCTRPRAPAGPGGEIAALVAERAFEYLDAPVVRVAPPDTPVPYSPPLEEYFLPNAEKVGKAIRAIYDY